MGTFDLKNAEQVRNSLTEKKIRGIRVMYNNLYKDIKKRVAQLGNESMEKQSLVILQKTISQRIDKLNEELQTGVINDMRIMSEAVIEDTRAFLKQCGFKPSDIHNAFAYVPDMIVQNIKTGNIYQNGWRLSDAIWGNSLKTRNMISDIIAKGVTSGKSAYDIAKDIEQYVKPEAVKKSKHIKFINPNTGKENTFYFGDVDYNAQCLARTLISHAYQQSFRIVNENDPFVTRYIWHSALLHGRTCKLCMSRDGKPFEKDELPEDHPNGLCTYEAEIPDSMNDIAKKIGEWYNSPEGTFPDIDKYAKDF